MTARVGSRVLICTVYEWVVVVTVVEVAPVLIVYRTAWFGETCGITIPP